MLFSDSSLVTGPPLPSVLDELSPADLYHIILRGNRRQQTSFCDDDYLAYINLLAELCHKYNVDIWTWCLMPNHCLCGAPPS
ncbi:MAG: transposase [Desulfuromonadales bacterium]|nr:transposase [Desulfuromonadales bacterium]